jgi:threonine/homoserine/homoserine lactone efflux protein
MVASKHGKLLVNHLNDMIAVSNFLLSFLFSFSGSLTPGTINMTAVQLGLEQNTKIIWRLALGAAIMEYVYAFLAVKFEYIITSSPVVVKNFHLLAAIVMMILGILNLRSASKPSPLYQKFNDSGFRRGLILGIFNPLAMPYWIAITAYLRSQHWVDFSSTLYLHSFLLGVSAGVFILLNLVGFFSKKVITLFQHNTFIKKIPGFILLLFGCYALIRYFILLSRS